MALRTINSAEKDVEGIGRAMTLRCRFNHAKASDATDRGLRMSGRLKQAASQRPAWPPRQFRLGGKRDISQCHARRTRAYLVNIPAIVPKTIAARLQTIVQLCRLPKRTHNLVNSLLTFSLVLR